MQYEGLGVAILIQRFPETTANLNREKIFVLFPVFVLTKTTLLFIFYDQEKHSMRVRGSSNESLKGARYVRYI